MRNFRFILFLISMFVFTAQGEIIDICYQKAYPSSIYDDSSKTTDQGGVAVIFFKSEFANESIDSISLNGTDLDTLLITPSAEDPTIDWYKKWPLSYTNAGQYGAVWVKAWDSPLKDGDTAHFNIDTNSSSYSMSKVLEAPELKIAYITPSQDGKSLFIYLRNTGSGTLYVKDVFINGDVSGNSYFIGSVDNINVNSPGIAAKYPGIIEVKYSDDFELMKLNCIKVEYQDGNGDLHVTGAAERIMPTRFFSGMWQSSLSDPSKDKTYGLENFRIDASLQVVNPAALYNSYGIETISTYTVTSYIIANQNNPAIGIWDLAEEPGDRSEIQPIIDSSYVAWEHSPLKPTYVNLFMNQKFGWYAPLADIVGMDHYVFFAPNVYNSFSHDIDEAYEYAKSLKLTAEPKPMWNWTQVNQEDFPLFGVNIQAWANIMYGAKGVLWWDYDSGDENDSDEGDQVAEAAYVMRQLNQINGLIQYSDFSNIINTTNGDVRTSALVSHDAMVVLVAADDTNMKFYFSEWASFPESINRETGTISFDVPDWINVEVVKQVSDTGFDDVAGYSINGRNVSINFDVQNRVAVYVIGAEDNDPPAAIGDIRLAQTKAEGTVFVWDEPFDNYGVKEYLIYKNNVLTDSSNGPVYVDANHSSSDTYKCAAVDSFGNISDFGYYDKINPSGAMTLDYGNKVTFYGTVNVSLTAEDTGSGVSEMRFYSSGWQPWQAYSPSAAVDISTVSFGNKVVYVQFRDAAGNTSATYNDDIIFTKRGDFDGDQQVDIYDLIHMSSKWLYSCGSDNCEAADVDTDGFIDLFDFAGAAENWQ